MLRNDDVLLLVDIVVSHDKANVNHQSVVHSSIVTVIFIPLEEVTIIINITIKKLIMRVNMCTNRHVVNCKFVTLLSMHC